MEIKVKFPDDNAGIDIQPFWVEESEKITKIGYKAQGNKDLVSIEKKDGYLYIAIDEREVVSVEKLG